MSFFFRSFVSTDRTDYIRFLLTFSLSESIVLGDTNCSIIHIQGTVQLLLKGQSSNPKKINYIHLLTSSNWSQIQGAHWETSFRLKVVSRQ